MRPAPSDDWAAAAAALSRLEARMRPPGRPCLLGIGLLSGEQMFKLMEIACRASPQQTATCFLRPTFQQGIRLWR